MTFLGAACALLSAVSWGSGDFTGGYASRRHSQHQVMTMSALSGALALVLLALLRREALPTPTSTLWAMLGGLSGALGIAVFYRALAIGQAAVVAPTAAVLTAAIPVGFSFLTSGAPKPAQLAGFGVALGGIWLVSRSPAENGQLSRQVFGMAILAGTGFGGFFILVAHIEPGPLFTPLVAARLMTFLTGLLLLRWRRLPLLAPRANPPAALAGLLDAGGNVFYLLASQLTRLDVAAVLAALYPAATVLLSRVLLKERIARLQWLGLGLCLVAIALISA